MIPFFHTKIVIFNNKQYSYYTIRKTLANIKLIPIEILSQPDDVTCGPTSLHAVYKFFGEDLSLNKIINEVKYLEEGGTLAVMLANHALMRGYDAEIYAYNLHIFDPSWFKEKGTDIKEKLRLQMKFKKHKKLKSASEAYIHFLELGGKVSFRDLNIKFLKTLFENGTPVLAGLNATYLYNCSREYTNENNETVYDDLKGDTSGHFVVLCGYDEEKKHVIVADPYHENPVSHNNYYSVRIGRLINSIMLGIISYDANLLIITPKRK